LSVIISVAKIGKRVKIVYPIGYMMADDVANIAFVAVPDAHNLMLHTERKGLLWMLILPAG
jgi:hypothetical protein